MESFFQTERRGCQIDDLSRKEISPFSSSGNHQIRQGTWRRFWGQEYPSGIHHPKYRWERKNFVTATSLIRRSSHSDQCLFCDSVIPGEVKDKFYDELASIVKGIPEKELKFILGDFNTRVGADQSSWPTCLGHVGIGKMNEIGQRLLELCCHHSLRVSKTYLHTKPQHRVPWRHPSSKHWHQLDPILTSLSSIKIKRGYQGAYCDTDNLFVCSRVKVRTKKLSHKKGGRASHWHQQNPWTGLGGGIFKCAWGIFSRPA